MILTIWDIGIALFVGLCCFFAFKGGIWFGGWIISKNTTEEKKLRFEKMKKILTIIGYVMSILLTLFILFIFYSIKSAISN